MDCDLWMMDDGLLAGRINAVNREFVYIDFDDERGKNICFTWAFEGSKPKTLFSFVFKG